VLVLAGVEPAPVPRQAQVQPQVVERGVGAAKRVHPWRAALALRLEQRFLQPRFERLFIADSYANRVGKGTHRAVDRLQQFAQRYAYVLRADIVRHFPSIDHAILRATLARTIPEDDVLALVDRILASGIGVLDDEYEMVHFPGDDLLAACRPRGLPIGNLSSQFWSNCYLHPFDQFVTRELRCPAYLRYVDDFALFSDSKRELWAWKRALVDRLAQLRLTIHAPEAQVLPTRCGIPWLGFVVYPTHRLLKARKVRATVSHLGERLDDYRAGRISFGEFDASVKGWVNHIRYADSWGLRKEVFRGLRFTMRPRSTKAAPEWAAVGDGGKAGAACEPGRPLRVTRNP